MSIYPYRLKPRSQVTRCFTLKSSGGVPETGCYVWLQLAFQSSRYNETCWREICHFCVKFCSINKSASYHTLASTVFTGFHSTSPCLWTFTAKLEPKDRDVNLQKCLEIWNQTNTVLPTNIKSKLQF